MAEAERGRILASKSSFPQTEAEEQIIFNSVPAMIWYKDKENRIIRCNPAAAKAMDMSVEQAEGRSLYDLYPEEAAAYHRDDLKVIRSGKPKLGVVESFTAPGGGKRWNQTDKIPYRNEAGVITGLIVIATDITKRMEAEQILLEREQVQSEFIANVSHELRTPITTIRGFAETLLRRGGLEDEKNRKCFVKIIESHAERLGSLVEDMLLLSSIDAEGARLCAMPINLHAFMEEHKADGELLAAKKGISIRLDVPRNLTLMADEPFLVQVVENLIGNAIKFGRPGGWVAVGAARAGSEVRVSIADNGPGIGEADLPRVFDRFYKADKARRCGYGLGLHIVKKMIEFQKGRIWVSSRVGAGSTFSFALPAAHAGAARAPRAAARKILNETLGRFENQRPE